MTVFLLPFVASGAFAQSFYHPDDIAEASALFARSSDTLSSEFDRMSAKTDALAGALLDYELGLDLLGGRASPTERARLDALSREYNREAASFRAFSDTLIEDFDGEFQAALTRAVTQHPGAMECKKEIPAGPALPGIGARTKPNPACQGEDLNAKLAAVLDADPALNRAVTEILALAWPAVDLDATPQAAVGGNARWVLASRFFRTAATSPLKQIDAEDREARLPFAAAMEQGASKEDLAQMLDEAKAITAETARKRASLAAPVLAAADPILAKWAEQGEPATGWCANPPILGGCVGVDATGELSPRILAQKKVAAALK